MTTATARAAAAPATSIVANGNSLPKGIGRDELLERFVLPVRGQVMAERPDLGAKTIVVMAAETAGVMPLMFFQGLSDGSVDPTIEVCGNSAACAVAVARHLWHIVDEGPVSVRMGSQILRLEEVR